MISIILFLILAYQRLRIDKFASRFPNQSSQQIRNRANIGLLLLGTISILNVYFNITLNRGWWNGDFFSSFFA
jgi:hypothetical protein